ncbi:hypothetical protein FRC01_000074 [Tulasnella sp. 417]|nr:hypothetical protein FRC01_000074 [Tulasnella sp. 417]
MATPIPPIDIAKAAFNMLVTRANQGDTALPDDSARSILTLDSHIHAIEAMFAFLVTESNDYLLPVKQSQNTLAPIHALPDEVLVDIWLHCVEEASQVDDQLHTLALVCKSWHRGVMDYPVLWCHLQDTCKSDRYNHWVLQRSQEHPLHLRLLAQDPSVSNSLIDIAKRESRRWESFVLAPRKRGGFGTRNPSLSMLAYANLENLTRFEVRSRKSRWRRPDTIWLPATPSLREITLEGFPLHWETFNAPQLRALRISSLLSGALSFPQLVDLLRSTPFLEVLLLKHFSMSIPDALPHQTSPVLLPRLRALDMHPTPCKDLLYLIRTESLQQLLCSPASLDLWKPPLCPILDDIKSTGIIKLIYRDTIHIATDPYPFNPIEWPYHDKGLTTEGFAFTTSKGAGMWDFLDITQWVGSLGLDTIVNLDLGNLDRVGVDAREIPVQLLDDLPTLCRLTIRAGVNVDALFTELGRPKLEFSNRLHWPWPQLASIDLRYADLIGPQILIDLAQSRWGPSSAAPSTPEPSTKEERPPRLKSFSPPYNLPHEIRRQVETLVETLVLESKKGSEEPPDFQL